MRSNSMLMAFAGLLLLAGCDRKAPDEAAPINDVTEGPEAPVAQPARDESQRESNAAAASANQMTPPAISEEQQMWDDADATGLTSRLPDVNQTLPHSPDGASGSAAQY